jgi:hypothetical protein
MVRRVALVMGPYMPSAATPLHWLLYRREDIYATVHLYDSTTPPPDDFSQLKKIISQLKTQTSVSSETGCLAVGTTIVDALEKVR